MHKAGNLRPDEVLERKTECYTKPEASAKQNILALVIAPMQQTRRIFMIVVWLFVFSFGCHEFSFWLGGVWSCTPWFVPG